MIIVLQFEKQNDTLSSWKLIYYFNLIILSPWKDFIFSKSVLY